MFRVLVDTEGRVAKVEVFSESTPGLADKDLLQKVKTFRFKPMLIDGKPAAVTIPFKVTFKESD